jgi:hypothetical protein
VKLPLPRARFFGRDTQGVPNEVGLFVPPEAVFPGTRSTAAALTEVARLAHRPLRQRPIMRVAQRPIMRVADGRGVILDPTFYGERLSVGPPFTYWRRTPGRRTKDYSDGARKLDSRDTDSHDMRRLMFAKPEEFDPRKFLADAIKPARDVCKQRFEAFGSAGKASMIRPVPLEKMTGLYAAGKLAPLVCATRRVRRQPHSRA